MSKRISDTNVSQNPAAVLVWEPGSLFIWCLVKASKAISTQKAMRVIKAAKKESTKARRVPVACVENAQTAARNVTPAAISEYGTGKELSILIYLKY